MSLAVRRPLKRVRVRGEIEGLIREHELWGQRLPGYRELARQFGVCGRTLKRVLADMEADGVLERRHGSGTYVLRRDGAQRRTISLAIIAVRHFEELEGWAYKAEMIRGVLGAAARKGHPCTVLALDRPEEAERVWNARDMRAFGGFVVVSPAGPDMNYDLIHHLAALRKGPVTVLDRNVQGLPATGISDYSLGGARAMTRHLLRLGHRRIAFLDTFNREARNPNKYGGYRVALMEAGVPVDDDLVVAAPEHRGEPDGFFNDRGERLHGLLEEDVDAAVERLLALPDPPTAIFAFNDRRALAAVTALEKRGLVAGRDVSVAGYGDSAFVTGIYKELTSCRIDPRKFGEEAVRVVLEGTPVDGAREVVVPTRPFFRGSTGAPPKYRERRRPIGEERS